MLAIVPSSSSSQLKLLHPNILPCSIKHSGPMRISKRYWNPRQQVLSKHLSKSNDETTDGTVPTDPATSTTKVPTVYLRGRKLLAKRLPLPAGYTGHLLQKTNTILPVKPKMRVPRHRQDVEDDEEDEEEEEELPAEVKVVEEKGRFEEILVWGHESVPSEDGEDVFVRGLGEWVGWANRIHAFDMPT
ncbi:unnamed protein product [Zymoseptoria tritici ST99CH_1A5]|uniref:Uncharacterized protein n=2 Tax=Zymoseptoria tritici TaxID=1047171 RepID=A0A2H1GYB8_ZYMTR|nr:unnamed protein product [Zymoseptoria tritici ST99CH_1E4]SMY27757.1 unnamed protein product [Zymoseptoria tritici ST99CH_1A5]